MVFFFFIKEKTAYEKRISDWSSDVCSSEQPGFESFDQIGNPGLADRAADRRRRQDERARACRIGDARRHEGKPERRCGARAFMLADAESGRTVAKAKAGLEEGRVLRIAEEEQVGAGQEIGRADG